MRPIVTNRVAWSVGLSVRLVNRAKMAEPIKIPFGLRTRANPANHVLDAGPDPSMGRTSLTGKGRPVVKYRDTVQSSVQNWLNRSRRCFGCALVPGVESLSC